MNLPSLSLSTVLPFGSLLHVYGIPLARIWNELPCIALRVAEWITHSVGVSMVAVSISLQ